MKELLYTCVTRILMLVLLPLVMFADANAQNATYRKSAMEFRFGAGGSIFLGDLGGNFGKRKDAFLDLDFETVRYSINASAKVNVRKWFAVRADFNHARVFGNDALAAEGFRRDRNLSFKSNLNEVSLISEVVMVNFLKLKKLTKLRTELYAFGGLGVLNFNPEAKLNGIWYELRPLGTEGQGLIAGTKPYRKVTGVIPMGLGIRKLINATFTLGIELSMRKSFTDYIDDVSGRYYNNDVIREKRGHVAAELSDRSLGGTTTSSGFRGNPNENDNYAFLQVYLSKGISNQLVMNERQAFRKIGKKTYKCPKFE